MGNELLKLFGWDQDEDEFDKILKARFVDDEEMYNKIKGDTTLYNTLKSTEQSRGLAKRQKLFDVAATGGASSGGPAISLSGESGIGYADQRDITKTFPGAMSKEEEEYQKMLRARVGPSPGLFKW